jgi:predicted ATPase/DNA-binding winged helix-turn-helix (wHTH) protein
MPPPSTAEVIAFGPFRLSRSQRLLTKNKEPLKVGGRAFDLLSLLVENAGAVVSQRDLLDHAWPGIFVEDVSLRVRIADLRKLLEQEGDRYLANIPGRGYSFVGQVSREITEVRAEVASPRYGLPPLPTLIVGRADATAEICRALIAGRFLTIVGAGGIGKTTVALSAAWDLVSEFDGEVCFVELSPIGQAALLGATVVSAFGLPVHADDPLPTLVDRLTGRRVLLVLDSAEHLVGEAAALAERLFAQVADLHILVTTREALRVEGESVYQLPALESPPANPTLTLAQISAYSAAHLFLERASASGSGQTGAFTDADAPVIAGMCRKLGGVALALELAAGRVNTYGLSETAALLDSEFSLRWPGRRTAPPRHQTLNATLDWSYSLLSESERVVLRRLSVFAGRFTLASARHIAAHEELHDQEVLSGLNGLVAKSLVSTGASGEGAWFRLLDTTRSYARTKLAEAAEFDALRRRQTIYYRDILQETEGDLQRQRDAVDIDDIRAALRWSFDKGGDEWLGADLATYSAPVWLSKALLSECHAWTTKAAAVYAASDVAPRQLVLALAARGSAELSMGGFSKESTATWTKTLELAEALQDGPGQFFSYLALWGRDIRETWYDGALVTAERCLKASEGIADPSFLPGAEWMVGHTYHHLGRLEESQAHFNASLDSDTEAARRSYTRATGLDRRGDLMGIMANTLWMLGFPDQAQRGGERAIAEARALQFELSVGVVMIWAGLNRYLSGPDIGAVERDMVELLEHGRSLSVDNEAAFALSILGLCQARRGNFDAGRQSVNEGLRLFADAHMETFSPIVLAHLCEAAIGAHRYDEAAELMADLKARDRNPEHFCTPEILRVGALLLIAQGAARPGEALFRDALAMAQRQGALSWELRTATSAARFLISQGREVEALDMLAPIYERFTEGFETADSRAARDTLSKLDRRRFPAVHLPLSVRTEDKP